MTQRNGMGREVGGVPASGSFPVSLFFVSVLKAGPAKHSHRQLYANNWYTKMAYLGVSHYRVRGKLPFSPYQALDFLAAE